MYLGIIVDEKFKWYNHIQYISNSIQKLFYIFKSLICFLNLQMLKMVYFSIAQSIFNYGIAVWGGTYNIHLIKVDVSKFMPQHEYNTHFKMNSNLNLIKVN